MSSNATIDKKRTMQWAIAYRGQASGGLARYWFELVNQHTGRAHRLMWTSPLGGPFPLGAGIPVSTIDCPNYYGFRTIHPANFSDFDGAGAHLRIKSALVHTWITLSPALPIDPKSRSGIEKVKVTMKDWGVSTPGINANPLGVLSIDYGNGVPTCVEPVVPSFEPEDSEEVKIPMKITKNEDRFCISIPGDFLFEFDKDFIKENVDAKTLKEMTAGQRALHKAAKVIQATPKHRVLIEGYTDSIDTDEYNLDLSKRRAESIARWLTDPKKGNVKTPDILAYGLGEANPVVDNQNNARTKANIKAQAPNRRVDICLISR